MKVEILANQCSETILRDPFTSIKGSLRAFADSHSSNCEVMLTKYLI